MTIAGMGMQMEGLVLSWYVLNLTNSPFLATLVPAARMALNFLALFSGAIADRASRQRVLATVEFAMTTLGLGMLVLIMSGFLEIWHIFAITLVGGLVRIFQMPAAQSLVADTLPDNRVANGTALTIMGRNLSTILGPLIGGVFFQIGGPSGAYTVIIALYSLSGACALLVRTDQTGASKQGESIFALVKEGLRYVKGEPVLWATLILAVAINLTGWPLHISLMPIFARDVLGTGSAGLGMLMSAFGIGALLGSSIWASIRNVGHTGRSLILAVLAWHLCMMAFSASTSIPLSLAIILFMGMSFASTQVLMTTLLLRSTATEFRGRVMGLRAMAINAFTLGSANSGVMAQKWSAPIAGSVNAVLGIVMTLTLAVMVPKLRRA